LAGASSFTLGLSSCSVIAFSPLCSFHRDLPGLDLFRLGQGDGEDTVLAGGLHFIGVHLGGKPEHPAEKAGLPLPAVIIDIFFFWGNFAFPPHYQVLFLDGDVQVLGIHPRKLRPHVDVVGVFGNVDQRVDSHPVGIAFPAGYILKKGVHLPLETVQFLEGIPFKKDRHILSSIYQLVIQHYLSS
jgi:hypothetical protein